jgi:pimeloyl-ACP methyl ester carboxylesterase
VADFAGVDGDVWVRSGGSGESQLLLLHGLGATGDVWNGWLPLLHDRWRWIVPDLPGHGRSGHRLRYTFEDFAAAVATVLRPGATVVFGHSLGGVVGLALAKATGTAVTAVVGLGIKVAWTAEDLSQARALADRPITWYATRDEAAARYLRVSGLAGLLSVDDGSVDAGLVELGGRWRLAMDPGTFAVGAPDMPRLLSDCDAEVVLARGELDHMNTDDQLSALGTRTATLPGLGHNAHVESPQRVIGLLDPYG